ncbi:MAG: phytoene desaturase family protein [Angustibacter sp.]
MEDVDAVVVGAGPNGLAGAVVLTAAGLTVEVIEAAETIGGGARTAELTLPGYRHDVCSAVHPMAVASPFLRAFDLTRRGVEMRYPDIAYAHPLDGGRAGLAWQDLGRTAAALDDDRTGDGRAWRALLGPLVERWQDLVALSTSDLRGAALRAAARAPGTVVQLLARVLEQGGPAWGRRWHGDLAPALLTGCSAHAIAPPRAPAPAAAGLVLATLGHAVGWPIPLGGSQTIVDAMARSVVAGGGRITTGQPVTSLAELQAAHPRTRVVLLDVAPRGLLYLAGDRLPTSYARWLRRFRYGSAACKVDFALNAPVPWAAPGSDRAGTLHLGGDREEMLASEREVAAGRHPDRPYVLVAQPGVVDATRTPDDGHTLWTYAHVPAGSTRDLGDVVTAQVERFAPGFRDVVRHRAVVTAAQAERYNTNYVGGDIASGATSPWQLLARPVPRWDPYRTPVAGVYLCSASTPPGPAVHGMGGLHAAGRALRQVYGDRRDPLALVRQLPLS